ncbi:UNVERIFIED_CONTAM: hypothetical protein Sradi_0198000 [Sesamum radiatum]|uniref:Uncharacterized protein n=1 Tax=Sesamum radiatum TaxID=300843 RepID=A0AAW2W0X4_SESRA
MEGDDNSSRVDLNWVDFFIHIHDLPLNRMTGEMAEFIGNQIGQFRDVDLTTVVGLGVLRFAFKWG